MAQVASLLDIKALRGQYALLKNASGDGIRTELVAFLQLTELPWVYLIDITALGEPTSALATAGSALVFASAVAAARRPAAPGEAPKR